MLMLVSVSLGGCGLLDEVAKKAGTFAGTKAGTALARKAPAPKTTVIVEAKGGSFCTTTGKLGWPIRPNEKDIESLVATSKEVRTPILGTQEWGERQCGWKP